MMKMRRFTSQHVELMTKRQDLCLQRRSRPEQSDQRQPNRAANISHQPRASPNSTSLASRIEFPTVTVRPAGLWVHGLANNRPSRISTLLLLRFGYCRHRGLPFDLFQNIFRLCYGGVLIADRQIAKRIISFAFGEFASFK